MTDSASNGLLLRADLHTLYGLDLIGIEPETLTVRMNPVAADARLAGYDMLVGTMLRCGSFRPSRAALELRWFEFWRECLALQVTGPIDVGVV